MLIIDFIWFGGSKKNGGGSEENRFDKQRKANINNSVLNLHFLTY